MEERQKDYKRQRNRKFSMRLDFLEMSEKLYLQSLNNVAAEIRPEEGGHQQTC